MKEFEELNSDERNEIYNCKLNQRSITVFDNEIIDFENMEQAKAFVKDNYYSDTKLMFEYDDLSFPNTYVFVELQYETIDTTDGVWIR